MLTCGQYVVTKTFHTYSAVYANRVRLESTSGQPLQMFELMVLSSSNENVALQGLASQSSTLNNDSKFAASNANDGDNATFSHTNNPGAYWEVELNRSVHIHSVHIINRWCTNENDPHGCLCRLTSAMLQLYKDGLLMESRTFGNTCGNLIISEVFAPMNSQVASWGSSVPAKKVKLTSTTGQQLQMFEVQIISGGANVALTGTASQSSTFLNNDKFSASKVIDGSNTTFSHTSDANAWLEVDLN